jgi:glucokinase
MTTALFDIGGTVTRVAVSRDGRTFHRPLVYETPKNYAIGLRTLTTAIREQTDGWRVRRIIGGIAAPLNVDHTMTIVPSNLSGWCKKPFVADLRRIFRATVRLENDAALGGLGEATVGAGKGKSIVAYLAIGTGVGGARIVDQRIDASAFGFEPGNMVVSQQHGFDVTIESLLSGASLEKKFRQPLAQIRDRRVWRELEHRLAVGVSNIVVTWSPHVVVLGGSVGRSPQLQLKNVRAIVRRTVTKVPNLPHIVRGTLGDTAGLWGALALLK